MNKQAFTDGYMHKQAASPALLKRLAGPVGRWLKDPTGIGARIKSDYLEGQAWHAGKDARRALRTSQKAVNNPYVRQVEGARKTVSVKNPHSEFEHTRTPKEPEAGPLGQRYRDKVKASEVAHKERDLNALAKTLRPLATGVVGYNLNKGRKALLEKLKDDPENTADTPTAPTKKPNPLSKWRK